MESVLDYIKEFLPIRFSRYIDTLPESKKAGIKEIRLRSGKPVAVELGDKCIFAENESYVSAEDIALVMNLLCDYSMNSVKEKISKGFIPLKYGCRAGIAGEAVIKNGNIEFQRNINSINIRIAHEYRGCAEKIFNDIYSKGNVFSTLIVSPPMMGKTTLLRDIARSLGNYVNVAIIDERSEIASCFCGVPQFDTGKRTDVLDGCPKPEGIAMAVRSMAPDVIITDEIGGSNDCKALMEAAVCGVSFIAAMHADSIESAKKRQSARELFDCGIIKRVILLGKSNGIGTIEEVIKL